jgi:hypothetical protein
MPARTSPLLGVQTTSCEPANCSPSNGVADEVPGEIVDFDLRPSARGQVVAQVDGLR